MASLEEFVANVTKSGLVVPGELERARASVAPSPTADAALRLAQHLIHQGSLTPYQAKKILNGATLGFFLGGYRILKPLGEGGMGKVFLAIREGGSKKV